MSEASAIRQVQYIRNGNTLTPYLQSDMGDLFQEYQGTTDAPEAVAPGRAGDFHLLHACPWEEDVCITPFFTLHKRGEDFTACAFPPSSFDVVYFDAFAPEKQPEMWTHEVFGHLFSAMRPGGVLSTYCAKGAVRRMLQQAGFSVERLPGPPGGGGPGRRRWCGQPDRVKTVNAAAAARRTRLVCMKPPYCKTQQEEIWRSEPSSILRRFALRKNARRQQKTLQKFAAGRMPASRQIFATFVSSTSKTSVAYGGITPG